MRIHKVVNRVYKGTVYYRWVLSISPKDVRELGWTDGQELDTEVRGSGLWIHIAVGPRAARGSTGASSLEEDIRRKTIPRR